MTRLLRWIYFKLNPQCVCETEDYCAWCHAGYYGW